MKKRVARFLALTMTLGLLWFGAAACTSQSPSQFDQAQQESTERGASAVVKESTKGGDLNAYFPEASGEYERIFTQEKQGFAEIKLKQNGQDVAMMAISDVVNNPTAADKFKESTQNVDGFPMVQQGSKGTAVLVGNRYQVKVMSRAESFTPENREEWLGKFDLKGLENLGSRN